MGTGHAAKFRRRGDADKAHEVPNDRFIHAAGSVVAQIGEPFILRRDGREGGELRRRERAGGGEREQREVIGHEWEVTREKSYFQE